MAGLGLMHAKLYLSQICIDIIFHAVAAVALGLQFIHMPLLGMRVMA